jgi:hypothetical protein
MGDPFHEENFMVLQTTNGKLMVLNTGRTYIINSLRKTQTVDEGFQATLYFICKGKNDPLVRCKATAKAVIELSAQEFAILTDDELALRVNDLNFETTDKVHCEACTRSRSGVIIMLASEALYDRGRLGETLSTAYAAISGSIYDHHRDMMGLFPPQSYFKSKYNKLRHANLPNEIVNPHNLALDVPEEYRNSLSGQPFFRTRSTITVSGAYLFMTRKF